MSGRLSMREAYRRVNAARRVLENAGETITGEHTDADDDAFDQANAAVNDALDALPHQGAIPRSRLACDLAEGVDYLKAMLAGYRPSDIDTANQLAADPRLFTVILGAARIAVTGERNARIVAGKTGTYAPGDLFEEGLRRREQPRPTAQPAPTTGGSMSSQVQELTGALHAVDQALKAAHGPSLENEKTGANLVSVMNGAEKACTTQMNVVQNTIRTLEAARNAAQRAGGQNAAAAVSKFTYAINEERKHLQLLMAANTKNKELRAIYAQIAQQARLGHVSAQAAGVSLANYRDQIANLRAT